MNANRIARAMVVLSAAILLAGCTGTASESRTPAGADGYSTAPPPSGSPTDGGNITFGVNPGVGPTWIFPYQPSQYANQDMISGFINLMWRPLYWSYKGVAPEVDYGESLAEKPQYSSDTKTITIPMRDDYTWSDGSKVTAADVVFSLQVLKAAVKDSAANYFNYTPGQFPDNIVSATATDPKTVVLQLSDPVNPAWFTENILTQVIPLPSDAWNRTATEKGLDASDPGTASKIYAYLSQASTDVASYGTNPLWKVVNGPFVIKSYTPSTTDAVLSANRKYTGPGKPHIDTFTMKSFTSPTALQNALTTGDIDAARLPQQLVPSASSLKAKYNILSGTGSVYYPAYYNFKNTTGEFSSIIGQRYIREALAHLQDQSGVIKGVFKGFAVPSYGPLPSSPKSAFTSEHILTNPYPFSIEEASKILSAHGWKVTPGGTTTCAKPGKGDGQCGAGISAGAKLSWNMYYNSGPTTTALEAQAFASNAQRVGIKVELIGKDANYLIKNMSNITQPQNADKWAMLLLGGQGGNLNPTTNTVFNTEGSQNTGSYSNPEADKLIQASIVSDDDSAVRTELEFLALDQPALFTPARSNVVVWKRTVSSPTVAVESLITTGPQPQYWYLTK